MGHAGKAIGLLSASGVNLTLVDVGASLEPFTAFQPLLGHATYIGFDPDLREMHDQTDVAGRRVIVNSAVVAGGDQETARFYLTENPTCSSTLPPDAARLGPYLFADRFTVVDTADVPAITLDVAMAKAGVERIDWIKLDTQGTDKRLLLSLSAELWQGLMAVDAEPGFEPYYDGEDTFGDLHQEMVTRGYWLADLVLTTTVRLRRQVFDEQLRPRTKLTRRAYEFSLKPSPVAAGPRYLRTIESLERTDAGRDDYLRLWACAYFSGNHPFALDVIAASEKAHGSDDASAAVRRLTVARNKRDARRNSWRLAQKLKARNIRRFISKSY